MGVVNTICCVLITILAIVGGVTVVLIVSSMIDEYIKRQDHKRAKRHMLHFISGYCDLHHVPIWVEENATRLIQNDYPLDKVVKMLEHRALTTEATNKLIKVDE